MTEFGKVIGRFITPVVDSADVDLVPDFQPLVGTISFTLNVPRIIDLTDPLNPVVIGTSPIVGVLNGSGALTTPLEDGSPGAVGLWLPAGDDPDFNPTDTIYTVTYSLRTAGGKPVALPSHTLMVVTDATLDLALIIPPAGVAPIGTAAAEAAAALAIQAADSAVKTVNGVAPDGNGNVVVAGGSGGGVTSVNSQTGAVILTAGDVGALPSNTPLLTIGTTSATAKAGDYQPSSADISDATTVGKALIKATDAAAGRTAIGAGTSNLALGTTSSTAKAGDYQPTAANISDATTVGRNVLKAADATAARTVIGAGTSNLALGTTAGTAMAGNTSLLQIGTTAGTAADAAATTTALAGKEPTISAGTTSQYRRGDKSWQTLDKAAVGLSNVQNLAIYVLAPGDPDPTGASPVGLYVRQTS